DCLLIDELGYVNLRPEQTNIFFKLMEERYRRKPTIITSNLDYPEWQTFLGNKVLVDALLSRLRHQCHTIRIDGPSLRDPQGSSPPRAPPPLSRSPFPPPHGFNARVRSPSRSRSRSQSCSSPGSFLKSRGGSILARADAGRDSLRSSPARPRS